MRKAFWLFSILLSGIVPYPICAANSNVPISRDSFSQGPADAKLLTELINRADDERQLSQYDESIGHCKSALSGFEQLSEQAANSTESLIGKSKAFIGLGQNYDMLSRYDDAKRSIMNALEIIQPLVKRKHPPIEAWCCLAQAYVSMGDLLTHSLQYEKASSNYSQALAICATALKEYPTSSKIHAMRSSAFNATGELWLKESRPNKANNCFHKAAEEAEIVMTNDPDDFRAQNNKGLALLDLGKSRCDFSNGREAIPDLDLAIAIYSIINCTEAQTCSTRRSLAMAYLTRAQAFAKTSQPARALADCISAQKLLDRLIKDAPADFENLNTKGCVQQTLGDLFVSSAENTKAKQYYQASIDSFEKTQKLAPHNNGANFNKGRSLLKLGQVKISAGELESALTNYSEAIKSFDDSLCKITSDYGALTNKRRALIATGDIYKKLGKREQAMQAYQDPISSLDLSLKYAPRRRSAISQRNVAKQEIRKLGEKGSSM